MAPGLSSPSNLTVRTVSAMLFVPVVLLLILVGGWALFLLVLFIVVRGSWEFFAMARQSGRRPLTHLGLLLAAALCLHIHLAGTEHLIPALLAIALIIFTATLFRGTTDFSVNVLLTLGGVIYLGLMGSAPLLITASAGPELRQEAGRLVAVLFLCIWLTDAVAYLAGRQFGRRKLAPRISPAKTIVGALAGLAGGLLPLGLVGFLPSFCVLRLSGLLLLASVGGQTGDLVESAIKRDLGVKDAPPLIPGHGGVLDRFDSYLFALPLSFIYITLLRIY